VPKQTHLINRFDGGINTHFNKRDIPDNTLIKAENIMVDKHGKIRLIGTTEDSTFGTLSGTTYPGYGIFPFQSDYDNPVPTTNIFATHTDFNVSTPHETHHSSNTDASPNYTTWSVVADSTATGWYFQSVHTDDSQDHPQDNTGSGWHHDYGNNQMICQLGSTVRNLLLYRNLNSDCVGKTYKIVVSSRRNVTSDNNKWRFWAHRGINSVNSTSLSDWITPTGSEVEYSAIFQLGEGANGNIGIQSYSHNDVDFDITQFAVYQVPSLSDTKYVVMQNENVADIKDLTNDIWRTGAFNLDKDDTVVTDHPSQDTKPIYYIADGILRAIDTNFNNANTISKWYGVINRTNFVDGEGNAQFLEWLSADQKLYPPSDTTHADGEDHNPGKVTIENDDSVDTSNYPNLASGADDGLRFHYGMDKDTDTATNGTWQGTFKFYISYLYDLEKQESGLFYLGYETNTADNVGLACAFTADYYGSYYRFNKRVTGARVYYTDADDSDGIYYQLMEVDFVQGCKKYDDLSYTAWAVDSAGTDGQNVECPEDSITQTTTQNTSFHFLHPPKVLTYQAINGYDADEHTIFKYKTAVIANRRCYIGNVGKLDTTAEANNIVEKFNDRIIKSPVNKFDTFPEGNFLDVTVNDGDEIIRLETFADRLLQFKRQKLFIINISQDIEFLESEHSYMGIDHHAAVTKTEIGVVWTNKRGCYIYDGKQVKNLIDQKISHKEWSDFLTTSGMIGYIPDKKQIIVFQSPASMSTNVYIYDFLTTSWTNGKDLFESGAKTNIILNSSGEMLFGQYTNQTNDVDISVGTNHGGSSAVSASTGIPPTAEINFNPISTATFQQNNAVSWRVVLGRSEDGADIEFTSGLGTTGTTFDALTNVLPASTFVNTPSDDEEVSNVIFIISRLVNAINAHTSTTKWSAERNGYTLKITYTGPSAQYGVSGDGQGTTDSGKPSLKALAILVATSGDDYKFYTDTSTGTMVMAESNDTAATYSPWVGGARSLFQSVNASTLGEGSVSQITQLSFLNMPGSGAANISAVSFYLNVKTYDTFRQVDKDVDIYFTPGQDLTDYEGGFDTNVPDSLDTNQELATAIKALMNGNSELSDLTFGTVTDSSVADGFGSGDTNIYYFDITGKSDYTPFEITRSIISGRYVTMFRNNSNSNGFITAITKDIDFKQPGVRKNIYKVYVTFKTTDQDDDISQTHTKIYYQTDGADIEQEPKDFDFTKSINYGESTTGFKYDESIKGILTVTLADSSGLNNSDLTTADVELSDVSNIKKGDALKIGTEVMLVTSVDKANTEVNLLRGYQSTTGVHSQHDTVYIYPKTKSYVAEIIPSTPIRNIYSFQLMIQSAAGTPAKFEIEDVSIIYRIKSTR
jgi:hypothetical protein